MTTRPAPAPHPRKVTKTARFLDMATERHGSLASIPLHAVAGLSAERAPLVGLHPGTARVGGRTVVPAELMDRRLEFSEPGLILVRARLGLMVIEPSSPIPKVD